MTIDSSHMMDANAIKNVLSRVETLSDIELSRAETVTPWTSEMKSGEQHGQIDLFLNVETYDRYDISFGEKEQRMSNS